MVNSKRNQYLNVIEAIAAYSVVFQHCLFPGFFGRLVKAYALYAVPLFFCVSGYFFYRGDRKKEFDSIPRKIKHLLNLIIVSEGIYYAWSVLLLIRKYGVNLTVFIQPFIDQIRIYQPYWLLSTMPLFNGVGWFILQLMIAYLVWGGIILRFNKEKIGYVFIPFGIVLGFVFISVLRLYGVSTMYIHMWSIFDCIPYFGLGYWLRSHRDNIAKFQTNKCICLLMGIGVLIQALEIAILGVKDISLGTCFVVVALFLLAIKNEDNEVHSIVGRFLSNVGEKCATIIYIIHPLLISILNTVTEKVIGSGEIKSIVAWIMPLAICVIVTMLAICVSKASKMQKK